VWGYLYPSASENIRREPSSERMSLTSLSAAPGRRERCLVRHGRAGRPARSLSAVSGGRRRDLWRTYQNSLLTS
jgi:hypothetical protein